MDPTRTTSLIELYDSARCRLVGFLLEGAGFLCCEFDWDGETGLARGLLALELVAMAAARALVELRLKVRKPQLLEYETKKANRTCDIFGSTK